MSILSGTAKHAAGLPGPAVLPPAADVIDRAYCFDDYRLVCVTSQDRLTADAERWIVECLIRAMPELKMREYFAAKRNWFSEFDFLVLAAERGGSDIVGLMSSRWQLMNGAEFLHISTIFIAERYRRSGLIKHMSALHMHSVYQGQRGFPRLVALKTCNPTAFSCLRMFSALDGVRFYPRITGRSQDRGLMQIACSVAAQLCPGLPFCCETAVIRNASVPLGFYRELPVSRKDSVNRYFDRHLTPDDRILCLVSLSDANTPLEVLRVLGALNLQRRYAPQSG
jgi:hypothetical protein